MGVRKTATTDAAIRNAKPETRAYKMSAGQGMYLLVNPSGSKLWRLKYRIDGKEKVLSFGAYPETSLADARLKREQARQLIAQNIDPLQQVKEEKQAAKVKGLTFADVAEQWFINNTEKGKKPWAPATAKKARLYLDKDLLPALGNRPIADIKRKDLIELNRAIEERGAFDIAKKIRNWLAEIFDIFCNENETANPAARLKPSAAAKGVETVHHPTVSFNELPALLNAVDNTSTAKSNKLAIRVLLFTAVRPGELRLATWKEFDFKNRLWIIPAERMKMRKEHTVPLPDQAVSALLELQALAGFSDYVLPNSKGKPISDATINKAFKMAGYAGRQTGHGFRHLISTQLNEWSSTRGYSPDWIEAQLAHKTTTRDKEAGRGADRSTYNHAIYLEGRAKMMQEWADSITAIIDGADVSNLNSRGA